MKSKPWTWQRPFRHISVPIGLPVRVAKFCEKSSLDEQKRNYMDTCTPGNILYTADIHPVFFLTPLYLVSESRTGYWGSGHIHRKKRRYKTTLIIRSHPPSEVIEAPTKTGIRVEADNEYPYSPDNCCDAILKKETGKFYFYRIRTSRRPLCPYTGQIIRL